MSRDLRLGDRYRSTIHIKLRNQGVGWDVFPEMRIALGRQTGVEARQASGGEYSH